jgi:hypothetical protein
MTHSDCDNATLRHGGSYYEYFSLRHVTCTSGLMGVGVDDMDGDRYDPSMYAVHSERYRSAGVSAKFRKGMRHPFSPSHLVLNFTTALPYYAALLPISAPATRMSVQQRRLRRPHSSPTRHTVAEHRPPFPSTDFPCRAALHTPSEHRPPFRDQMIPLLVFITPPVRFMTPVPTFKPDPFPPPHRRNHIPSDLQPSRRHPRLSTARPSRAMTTPVGRAAPCSESVVLRDTFGTVCQCRLFHSRP